MWCQVIDMSYKHFFKHSLSSVALLLTYAPPQSSNYEIPYSLPEIPFSKNFHFSREPQKRPNSKFHPTNHILHQLPTSFELLTTKHYPIMDTLQNTHHAMATLATGSMPTPVAFSPSTFLYPFSLLMTAIGTQRLMPNSDVDSVVINVKSGYARRNQSFILGRLLRDWPLERKAGDGMHGLYVTVVDAVKAPQNGQGKLLRPLPSSSSLLHH